VKIPRRLFFVGATFCVAADARLAIDERGLKNAGSRCAEARDAHEYRSNQIVARLMISFPAPAQGFMVAAQ
jgi:tRNA G46 methylase TrmB